MKGFLSDLRKKDFIVQLYRYGVIGVISNLAGYMIYLLSTYLGSEPKLTMSFLYVSMALVSYLGNRKLTFDYNGNVINSGLRYFIAHSLGYLINLMILIIMVDILGYSHQWVQALAIFIVALFLFMALKYFVFKENIR